MPFRKVSFFYGIVDVENATQKQMNELFHEMLVRSYVRAWKA